MNAGALIAVDTDTLIALSNYLEGAGSQLSLSELASLAIRDWLADHTAEAGEAAPGCAVAAAKPAPVSGARGYQWKELFLPDGTDLRMSCNGEVHHARIIGDAIIHQGRSVSPRQFTIQAAGDGRNAWRDVTVRLPGEKHFRPACLLRSNLQAKLEGQRKSGSDPAAESPAAAIAAAAAAMSEALRSALALVELSNQQAVPKFERRGEHRRSIDVMADHVAFD